MARFHSPSDSSQNSSPPEDRGWFYEIEGTKHGPVAFRTLRALALDRKVLGHHLVWKGASGEKLAASSIVGLIPPSPGRSPVAGTTAGTSSNPYATPGTIVDGPPGGLYLPHLPPANFPLYLGCLVVATALPIWLFFFAKASLSVSAVTLTLTIAGLSLLTWIGLSFTYLHRAWTMLRSFGGGLTGGKAIRYLFIPFFNALWCFVALFGWSKFWNFQVQTHPGMKPAKPVWQAAFFLFPIVFLISQGLILMHLFIREWPNDPGNTRHLTSLAIWAVTLIVGLICWGQIARSINFLARKKF